MIDYDWYRSFLAIYRNGTITRAAEERGLTQPALSQHLAALETAIGTPLFTRTARRMVPTDRGTELYNQVVGALETLDRISLDLQGRQTVQTEIRFGTPREYFGHTGMACLLGLPIRSKIVFGTARALLEALREGDVDLVMASERLLFSDVEYRKLAEEEFALVGGAEVTPPLVEPQTTAEREQLAEWALHQPWLSYARDLPIIRRFWRQCFGLRPQITPQMIVPDLLLLIDGLSTCHGLSVIPAYLGQTARANGRLKWIWSPRPAVTNDLWIAYRTRDRHNPTLMRVRDALLQRGLGGAAQL